jgi:SAM-dependent methyltransferase
MHPNSFSLMSEFVQGYLRGVAPGTVLDVGSYDVNGNYKSLWKGWDYLGVDIEAGPNVDQVVPVSGEFDLGRQYDVVISGQCLEHCNNPFTLAATMGKHLKPGGLACWIAPAKWPEHRHPQDCWRFLPDGMRHLLVHAGIEPLEVGMCPANEPHLDGADCFGVGRKRQA